MSDNPSRGILEDLRAMRQEKWGWVIYRTCYRADLDAGWTRLKERVDSQATRESLSQEVLGKMTWTFKEGPTLDGASPWELQRHFRAWVDASVPVESPMTRRNHVQHPDGVVKEEIPGSRYQWFVFMDAPALESIRDGGIETGWVNVFDSAYDRYLNPPEEQEDEDRCKPIYGRTDEDLGFKRIAADMVSPDFYYELHSSEDGYILLPARPPRVNVY